MTLNYLISLMEESYEELQRQSLNYPSSGEFKNFLIRRGNDLKEFKRLVSGYRGDAFVPDVVSNLKYEGVLPKYLGMTQKPTDYFKITKKLQKALDAGL